MCRSRAIDYVAALGSADILTSIISAFDEASCTTSPGNAGADAAVQTQERANCVLHVRNARWLRDPAHGSLLN
jgi:hypothetical protein